MKCQGIRGSFGVLYCQQLSSLALLSFTYQLVAALNWACGNDADCRVIQVNQPCYIPNTVKDHASYAFNSNYQNMKHKGGSCYFNTAAVLSGANPIKIVLFSYLSDHSSMMLQFYVYRIEKPCHRDLLL